MVLERAAARPSWDRSLERLQRLQRLSGALAGALTVADVADAVVVNVSEELRADAAMICLLSRDRSRFEIVRQVGYLPETVRQWQQFPVDAPLPAGDAIRSGAMVVFESLADRDRRYPALRGAPSLHRSFAIIPVIAENTALGILSLGFNQYHAFPDDERDFLQAVTDQCAQAIHRAQLYEQQRMSAERQAFLAQVSQRLAKSLSTNELAAQLAAVVVPAVADVCLVHVDSSGALRLAGLAFSDESPSSSLVKHIRDPRFARDPRLRAVLTDRRPVLLLPDSKRSPQPPDDGSARLRLLDVAEGESAAIVPLVARERTVGTLTVATRTGRRPLGEDDVALLDDLADYAALALDNAELFQERSRIAHTLQMTLLPPALPDIPGLEVGASYLAAGTGSDVGGDFYDVFRAADDRWVLVLGDVCGRGVDAAATTGLVRHTVRAVGFGQVSPIDIVGQLNRALQAWLREHGDEPEPRFCALNVAVVEPSTRRVTLCCAGNPLPQVVSADGTSTEIGRPGTVAGVLDDVELEEVTTVLAPGDVLVAYTDGITERRSRERFFEEMLPQVMSALPQRSAQEAADFLRAAAEQFAEDVPADDMAVVVLRVPDSRTDSR